MAGELVVRIRHRSWEEIPEEDRERILAARQRLAWQVGRIVSEEIEKEYQKNAGEAANN